MVPINMTITCLGLAWSDHSYIDLHLVSIYSGMLLGMELSLTPVRTFIIVPPVFVVPSTTIIIPPVGPAAGVSAVSVSSPPAISVIAVSPPAISVIAISPPAIPVVAISPLAVPVVAPIPAPSIPPAPVLVSPAASVAVLVEAAVLEALVSGARVDKALVILDQVGHLVRQTERQVLEASGLTAVDHDGGCWLIPRCLREKGGFQKERSLWWTKNYITEQICWKKLCIASQTHWAGNFKKMILLQSFFSWRLKLGFVIKQNKGTLI